VIGTMVNYGNPFDPEVTSAPLINTRQLDRVLGLIARGQEEGAQLEPNSPFGGYRQSGLGREGGRAAVESYTELKTVLLPFTDEMM
jgi:acyl-CoA reductase-like NAD-dependent aldehyde dehydrogenase